MTNQNETVYKIAHPDEVCAVCNTKRMNHGDMQHEFSLTGQLINKADRPEPKKEAPKLREADEEQKQQEFQETMETNAILRLTEVLIDKGVIDGKDTMYIFSGFRNASS